MRIKMKPKTKVKQIVVRFDQHSYETISRYAEIEHRTLGEFVRHAALDYIEKSDQSRESTNQSRESKNQSRDSTNQSRESTNKKEIS